MHELGQIFPDALMITGFVSVMMVVIEYVNVLTRGRWQSLLARWTWGQSVMCAGLGAVPGCLGAYAVTSLYMHRVVTVGATVAAMIATCGDEAFVMLALFPRQALLIFVILFGIGVVTGVAVDMVGKAHRTTRTGHLSNYQVSHPDNASCVPFSPRHLIAQWKNCTPHRGWLALVLVLFIAGAATGRIGHSHLGVELDADGVELACEHGHDDMHGHEGVMPRHGNWFKITLLLVGVVGLAIVATVPDHFLDEHLWNHIARVHAWRIFLWTLLALLVTHFLVEKVHITADLASHSFLTLLAVCLVGLIPQSGPHLVVVTLFAGGAIPFSTLLASCIVQDGHGMIPMLAHSRMAFLVIKAVNFTVGILIGLLGLWMAW